VFERFLKLKVNAIFRLLNSEFFVQIFYIFNFDRFCLINLFIQRNQLNLGSLKIPGTISFRHFFKHVKLFLNDTFFNREICTFLLNYKIPYLFDHIFHNFNVDQFCLINLLFNENQSYFLNLKIPSSENFKV
jgi:hypothetical protein